MSETGEEPRTLGRYELLYLLGQGGMGEVHLARTTGVGGFEKLYIVKTILPAVKADPQFVERFQHEAKLVTHLTHASIAQVYDMGEADGVLYMAIEYVPGVDLARIQDRVRSLEAQIPIPVALYVCRQMLEALGYAHRKPGADGRSMGIVHRDVSPQNVMVSYEGEVKVIDFGLAKSAARSKATLPSTVLGKLGYMAPEQALAKDVDARGDIFSAGIVAWELLTGRPLYEGGTLAETLAKMANPKIPPIREFRPEVPAGVEQAVLRALEVDPAQRYPRADEFARALNEYMVKENLSVSAEEVGNYVRTMCPEEFLAERKLRSRLSEAGKKKSLAEAAIARPGTEAAYGATMMRPNSGEQQLTPAQRALSQFDAPAAAASRVQSQPPLPLPGPRASSEKPMLGSSATAQPKRRPAALILLVLGLVVLAGGIGTVALRRAEPPPKPVEPVKVVEPVKPIEPVKPVEPVKPEEPVKPDEPAAATPTEPVPLGRVEVKKPLKVFRDKGEYWVKLDKPHKVRIGDTFKVVGPPLPDSKKEREWFAEGTVMEKKNTLARINLEPADALLPKELGAVPAEKEVNLRKRLAREGNADDTKSEEKKPDEKKPEAQATADAGRPAATLAAAEKPDAGTTDASKPTRKVLTGTLHEGAFGVNLTNTSDYAWTHCKLWRPAKSLYVWPDNFVLEAGGSESVGKGKFEEQDAPPKGFNDQYHLMICREGAGYLKNN